MENIGVVFGRFQIMHLGYMEYILAAKMKCDHLIIGIGNPDMDHLQYNHTQADCLKHKMNPFTYYERMEMIRGALKEFGVTTESFTIVPFPLENPPVLSSYLPMNAVYFINVFDEWSKEKKAVMESLGYPVEILRFGNEEDKKTRSSVILEAMGKRKPWDRQVPKSVAVYIKENKLDERVRALWKGIRLGPRGTVPKEILPPFQDRVPETENLFQQQKRETEAFRERERKREKQDVEMIF